MDVDFAHKFTPLRLKMAASVITLSISALFMIYVNCIYARSWRDIEIIHNMSPTDNSGIIYLEMLALKLLNDSTYEATWSPVGPNHSDTTFAPSPLPSDGPTIVPTVSPSDSPSSWPSQQPSDHPSETPSAVPTTDPYPRIKGPNEGERGYFNYDQSPNSTFGPSMWGYVRISDFFYWDEFSRNGYGPWKGALSKIDYRDNQCERGMKHQSPIDVFETVYGCNETHEIRDHNGDFPLNDARVEKRIESNKLRLIFPRRPCFDLNNTECQFPHPPWADFPNGFRGIADATHIDFKIPSEHWLRGESFDGELQIFHMHPSNGRAVAISTLIRATEQGHNQHFQLALDAFQEEYDKNQAGCTKNKNVGIVDVGVSQAASNATIDIIVGGNVTTGSTNTWKNMTSFKPATTGNWTTSAISSNLTNWTTPLSTNTTAARNIIHTLRDLHNIPNAWSPYHPDIMPTIYFYRYEGSITEPPCSEFVTWFINDVPTTISYDQLEQWRTMQFTNVDPNTCTSTSVHFGRSVARPIQRPQPTDRVVTRCTAADFGPDLVRAPLS